MKKLKSYLSRPLFVNEHGSWAMITVPLLTGILHHGEFPLRSLLFAGAGFFIFFVYRPAEIAVLEYRRSGAVNDKFRHAVVWVCIYLFVAACFVLPLVIIEKMYGLLLLGIFGAAVFTCAQFVSIRFKSAFARDLIAIFGLTSLAPAALYVTSRQMSAAMPQIWAANAAFFMSSAFYIHMLFFAGASAEGKKEHMRTRRQANIRFQTGLLCLIAAAAGLKLISFIYAAAFLPMLLHSLIGSFLLHTPVSFRRLGFTFLGYSIWFCLLISI